MSGVGLIGFASASALGGLAVNQGMLFGAAPCREPLPR